MINRVNRIPSDNFSNSNRIDLLRDGPARTGSVVLPNPLGLSMTAWKSLLTKKMCSMMKLSSRLKQIHEWSILVATI